MQCLTSAPNLGGGRVGWHLEPAFPSPWIYPPLRVVKMVHITSIHFFLFYSSGRNTLLQRSSASTGCASYNVPLSNWQFWHIDPSTAPLRPTYSHVSPAFPTLRPHYGCGLLPHIVWTFRLFVSLQSAGGCFRFRVPPSGTTCLSTSHLRRHSRFSDNDSRPFCFPVPTKTVSYDSCVTITIHHYSQWSLQ